MIPDFLVYSSKTKPMLILGMIKVCGWGVREAKKYAGSRAEYTKKVKRFKRIICSDHCLNVIHELQDLTFKENRNGELIEDDFNIEPHTLSAIWYALDDYEFINIKGDGIRAANAWG